MSLVLKNSSEILEKSIDWRPTATLATLQKRASILQQIRQFFANRDVLEVETPLLGPASSTDPYLQSIPATFEINHSSEMRYLQTSPEHAMKRFLAAYPVAIYQICKAFRQGDLGRSHQPEFTMLEWYRPGFDHHDLMDEMDELLQTILNTLPAERLSYLELFMKYVQLNPHTASDEKLIECVKHHAIQTNMSFERDTWLHLLLTHHIEPFIGKERPIFLYDFPVSQAALAKVRQDADPPVASRFEVYFKGLELANGFHELQDATEQEHRFLRDLEKRKKAQLPSIPIDALLLSALKSGLPNCAGVALGVDRLMLLALDCQTIQDVIAFAAV